MYRLIALLGGWLLSAIASAGQVTLIWENAPGIAGSQIAIGSCNGDAYGQDVVNPETGLVEYIRLPADATEARIYRLEQGETFCFRVRHFNAAGTLSEWLFLGSKRISLDSVEQPPLLPMPPKPLSGSVT